MASSADACVASRCVSFCSVRCVSVSMVVSRKRPKGVRYYAPFGLSVLVMGLMPRSIGYQDLVALMARQSEVLAARARAHDGLAVRHHPRRDLQLSAAGRHPDPRSAARISSPASAPTIPRPPARWGDLAGAPAQSIRPRLEFPAVNRRLKGDLLVTRPRDEEATGRRHPRSDAGPGQDRFVPQPRCDPDERESAASTLRQRSRRRTDASLSLSHRCQPPKYQAAERAAGRHRARATRRCGSVGCISATPSAKGSAPSSPGRRTKRC